MGVTVSVTGASNFTYKKFERFPTARERDRLNFENIYRSIPDMEHAINKLLRGAKSFQKEGKVVLTLDPQGVRHAEHHIFLVGYPAARDSPGRYVINIRKNR